MKKIILLFIIFLPLISFSQERVNRPKLSFESVSYTLTNATGWAYNSELGEWIDYENVICASKDYKDKYKTLLGKYMMSKYQQNFITIQTKTFSFKDEKYYTLIVDKWAGSYEYPAIQKGWEEYTVKIGYIFTEDEYNKLKNLENDIIELKTSYSTRFSLRFDKYNEIKFLDLMQAELTREKSKYDSEYILPIMKSKEGNVRFYIPDNFNQRNEYNRYNFEEKYFETDIENFSKIIIE